MLRAAAAKFTSSGNGKIKKKKSRKGKLVECPICGRQVLHLAAHHRNIHTDAGAKKVELLDCPKCGKKVQKLKDHMRVHLEGKHICKVCDGKFKQGGSLKRHMVQIHNIMEGPVGNYKKKYKPDNTILTSCNVCRKGFHKYILKYHLLTHETEKVKCEFCSEEIKASMYTEHLAKVHRKTGKHQESKAKIEKEYLNCKFCGKLMLKDNLRDHERYHTTEIIFKCEECGAKL